MTTYMKAALLYGREDLRIEEVPVPELHPGEILIRVKTALTCGTDLKTYRRGYHVMIPKLPSPFGHEFAGTVAAWGEGVMWPDPGTPVAAANSAPCMHCEYCKSGRPNLCDHLEFLNGAYAQFVRVPAAIVRTNLHPLPTDMPAMQAALAEPLACVLHGLERSGVRMGQSVCVLGLGPIGLLFVALAAQKGAQVIAVGRSPVKLQKAKKLGAGAVVDMSGLSPKALREAVHSLSTGGRGADVVIEAVGLPNIWEAAPDLAKKGGLINLFGGCAQGAYAKIDAHRLHYEEKSIITVFHHTPRYVAMAVRLLAQKKIDAKDLVTHHLGLAELPLAFDLMMQQRAVKIAIDFPDG
jgi:L-iditol 2-dehydrogenase